LGVLGLTGLTAYFGLFDVGALKSGETVLVSGAAGATGSVVVQLAKLSGATVVAVAGSEEKCHWLKSELGADHVINYKNTKNLSQDIFKATPKGIDIFFDNVGGDILDIALARYSFFFFSFLSFFFSFFLFFSFLIFLFLFSLSFSISLQ